MLNEREAGAAIAGVEHYNRAQQERLSMVAFDTHGYTHARMAGAKLLGFDLYPRLRALAERKLYIPFGMARTAGRCAGDRTGRQRERCAQCHPDWMGRNASLRGLDPHRPHQRQCRAAAGVCDWSKPAVSKTGVVPYASFGPSTVNLVFAISKP